MLVVSSFLVVLNAGVLSNKSENEIKISINSMDLSKSTSIIESTPNSNPIQVISTNISASATSASSIKYLLNVNKLGTGFGSVTINPPQGLYSPGKTVIITAVPEVGSSFMGWGGSLTGTMNPVTITMDAAKTVTATFTATEYILTINVRGSGSISKNPSQNTYHYGDLVKLTPIAEPGYTFTEWSGDSLNTIIPNTIAINGNQEITATFISNTPGTYTLAVTPVGGGQVVLDKDGPYNAGEVVQLSAVPNEGWVFQGWSGDLTGTSNSGSITINGNIAVTAIFTQQLTLGVSILGSGTVAKSVNKAAYTYGEVIQLTATPAVGYIFAGWSGDLTGTSNPRSITIDGNKSVTAKFTLIEYNLSTINIGNGEIIKTPNRNTYHYGEVVKLTGVPQLGWSFTEWSGDIIDFRNPTTITIDGNMEVTATFALNTPGTYTLAVTPVGGGQVVLNKDGPYNAGEVVQLSAVPNEGWVFQGWSGDLTGSSNPASVTVDRDHTITATFRAIDYILDVVATGSGTVVKSPSKQVYNYGEVVQLTATPAVGYIFAGWSGDFTGISNPGSVMINGNKAVTATFTQQFTLGVSISSGGSVAKSPSKAAYTNGEVVQLTATSAVGYIFAGWSGDLTGTSNPGSITMNGNKAVTATFTQSQLTLGVSISGSGTVAKSVNKAAYTYGEVVQLTATPASGWVFGGWSGDVTGTSSSVSLTVTKSMAVTANFIQTSGEADWEIWKSGSTYYATGGLSSSSFLTLWNSVTLKLVSGDIIHLAGNTDYITTSTIVQPKNGITLTASPGARIRPADSKLVVFIFQNKGQNFVMDGVTISGLGATDNRDTFGWDSRTNAYQLAVMIGTDNVVIQNCIFEHHHQYLLQLSNCDNFIVRNNIFRYGQNGFATYGVCQGGIVENNLLHDCSQGPIKLRGCTGTIVRYNTIREEYTYWRGFDHLRVPGPDGRGVVGNTQGCQGIYFGVTDPQPNFNCEVYGNTITDASIHGTVNVIDVVDGTSRKSPPNSDGCWFPLDAGSTKSYGNKFYDNVVNGARYGVNIYGYSTRNPEPLTVYSDNVFTNIVRNNCYIESD